MLSRKNGKKTIQVLLSCMGYIFMSSLALNIKESSAEAWSLQPYVKLQTGYDNNVRMLREGDDSAVASTFSVAANIRRKSELSSYLLKYTGDFTQYSNPEREDLDDTDYQNALLSALLTPSEINTFSLSADFTRTYTDRTQGDAADDPDTEEGITRLQVKREAVGADISWAHHFTEASDFEFTYHYDSSSYGKGAEIVQLHDFDYHLLRLKFGRKWNEKNEIFFAIAGSHYRAEEAKRENNAYGLVVGNQYQFSEHSNLRFHVGGRNLSFDNEGDENEDDSGLVYAVSVTTEREKTRLYGGVERKLSPSASGKVLQSDVLVLNFSRELSQKISFVLSSRLFQNETVAGATDTRSDRKYALIEPVFRQTFLPGFGIDYTYRYRWQEREDEQGDAESHAVFLSLFYLFPTEE